MSHRTQRGREDQLQNWAPDLLPHPLCARQHPVLELWLAGLPRSRVWGKEPSLAPNCQFCWDLAITNFEKRPDSVPEGLLPAQQVCNP